MNTTNSYIAHVYAWSGVPVFPCREAGERAKSPYVANGYHQANTHPDLLKHWAAMYRNALYGLPCAPNRLWQRRRWQPKPNVMLFYPVVGESRSPPYSCR